MTPLSPEKLAAACLVVQCLVNIPLTLLLLKGTKMPVYPELQPALDELNASIAALPAAIAAKVTASESAGAQDKTDSIAAVQAAADALKAAVGS